MSQSHLPGLSARGPRLWLLVVLALSLGLGGCLGRGADEPLPNLAGAKQELPAPRTPEQILERMASTLQEMDTLSVQVDGFWAAMLQGGDSEGTLQLARPGKASWIVENDIFGKMVESVVSDGTPEGLVRWGFTPRDNTYRLRTHTAESWGRPPEHDLIMDLPLPGVLFHGAALEDWGLLHVTLSVADKLPDGALFHPLALSTFSTAEPDPIMDLLDEPPQCDCHGVEGWIAIQPVGLDGEGLADRLRLWIGREDNLPRRVELIGYRIDPGTWNPQDPFALVMELDDGPMPISYSTENYSNYLPNEPIPADTFIPHFPEGATLIEDEPAPEEPPEG